MIQGGGDPVPGMDPSSFENRQSMSVNQGHPSGSWSSASGQASVSWNFHQTSNGHGQGQGQGHVESTAPYYYDQPTQSSAPTGTSEGAQAQGYGGYYYNGYQHQNSDPSFQQVGASQNTGAPYQPLTSFPNPGPSYSATYYNAGDHQTGVWNASNYGTYNQGHNYPSYNPTETNTAAPASSIPYPQQYDPWANYYSSAAPVVSCPPGTENAAVPTVSVGQPFPVQGASGGYQYPSNQPPPPGTTSWRRDSASSGLPSLQVMKDVAPPNESGGWEVGGQGFQNPQTYPLPSYFQKPPDSNPPPHENYQSQQKNIYSQGLSLQLSSTNQVSENLQPPLQTAMTLDTRRVSKVQIPTNPRIAPSSVLGMPKIEKEILTVSPAMKPVYTSVSVPKLNNETPSHTNAEAMAKPTELPPSLTGYAQRTFARCKDDAERSVNQNIMFEMMRKASDDGTLFTINWDIEPLFPLPNANPGIATQSTLQSSITASSLPKFKRSPSRRTKSRWEPIAEEKLVERLASANNAHLKGSDKGADTRKYENRDNGWSGLKFLSPQQQTPMSKIGQRPMKKPRFENDGSSDSDKEQGLTKYYASAIALADTPEERKRREHRSKRFEKAKENQAETKHPRLKISGAGNVYIRRANAMVLAKNSEDGFNRAVEDIDWDSLTVKGTCLEIEKRYLRLTTAPDPTTVRPEEILEKALQMVQTSQKNYLYKCDQLKSIRQDLTVQRIQNELTVKVYETHARFALEAGDLPEYNQCQSQLTRLYAEGIKGSHMEFSAYNLLCVILHSDNKRDLVSSMARLSNQAKEDEAVKHALAVRSAVSSGNYILFFRLYKAAPNLSTYLMDLYVEKMRFEAVKCMSKSYRPTVPVKYIARVLGFSRAAPDEGGQTKGGESLEECKEWLQLHGAVLLTDEGSGELQMDGKASSSSLYMPEPEDAVAHGDASLGVDDFLTRASS